MTPTSPEEKPPYKKTRILRYIISYSVFIDDVDKMLLFNVLLAFVLTHLTVVSSATPIIAATSSLTKRDQECSNAPGTKAGTYVAFPPTPPPTPKRT